MLNHEYLNPSVDEAIRNSFAMGEEKRFIDQSKVRVEGFPNGELKRHELSR